jgi:hypothetical protein
MTITDKEHECGGMALYNSGLVLLFTSILLAVMVFWYNLYKVNKYEMNMVMYVFAGVILALAVTFSVILGTYSQNNFGLISILILPSSCIAFAIFFGMWMHNDFLMYEV